jgi:hypothetical protein
MEAKRDAYRDLYKSKIGTTNWYESISPQAREWLDGLAEDISLGGGREPVWATVLRVFTENFPDDQPKTAGTIASTVRRLRG